MRVERITPDTTRGKGWARVPFSDCEATSELASMAIVRPRHMEPYLGRMGWQISESRLPLSMEVTGESEIVLFLRPEAVQHLEVASNYEFWFFNRHNQRMHIVIVRWAGVSYRAPHGEASPIEVIQPDDLPPTKPIYGTDGSSNYFDKPPESEKFGSSSVVSSFGTNWGEIQETKATPPHAGSLEKPEESVVFPPPVQTQTQTQPRATGMRDQPVAKRIRCVDPSCALEILDSMKKCPLCGAQQ